MHTESTASRSLKTTAAREHVAAPIVHAAHINDEIHQGLIEVALIDAKVSAAAGCVSLSWWHEAVREGRAPKPAIRQPRLTRWRLTDVRQFWAGLAAASRCDGDGVVLGQGAAPTKKLRRGAASRGHSAGHPRHPMGNRARSGPCQAGASRGDSRRDGNLPRLLPAIPRQPDAQPLGAAHLPERLPVLVMQLDGARLRALLRRQGHGAAERLALGLGL